MDADRINILHAADHDGRIVVIAHDFKFNFLIAFDRLLDQHLIDRGQLQRVLAQRRDFLIIVSKPTAGAAEGERRS